MYYRHGKLITKVPQEIIKPHLDELPNKELKDFVEVEFNEIEETLKRYHLNRDEIKLAELFKKFIESERLRREIREDEEGEVEVHKISPSADNKIGLGQLPKVLRTLMFSYLDDSSAALLSATSYGFYSEVTAEHRKIKHWQEKIIDLGLNSKLLESAIQTNMIRNYPNLYRVLKITDMHNPRAGGTAVRVNLLTICTLPGVTIV